MENKKLAKKLKKKVIKQFNNDLKKSILKDLYKGISKEEIDRLKSEVLKEVKEELFVKIENSDKTAFDVMPLTAKDLSTDAVNLSEESTIQESSKEELKTDESKTDNTFHDLPSEEVIDAPKIHEHMGFKFDTIRMGEIVTQKTRRNPVDRNFKENVEGGVKRADRQDNIDKENSQKLAGINTFIPHHNQKLIKNIEDIKNGEYRNVIKNVINNPNLNNSKSHFFIPRTHSIIKYDERLTPSTKEDLVFFIEKLKKGISKLGMGQRNINYRNSAGNIYVFTYNKDEMGPEEFTLNFNIELNVVTLSTEIKDFRFNIDGFKFDSTFFNTIEIVKVLDELGFNISKYVKEISDFNSETSDKKETTNTIESLDEIIKDSRLVATLKKNEITNVDELLKFQNDYTVIKGIGKKTAQKIKKYLR